MIAPESFAAWMHAFATRLRASLDDATSAAYYASLAKEMDTPTWERAAARVFSQHAYNTWPAPIEFLAAAAAVRRQPDAEVRETMRRYIEPHLRLPSPRVQSIEAFHELWQRELAHCRPAPPTTSPANPSTGDEARP